MSEPLKLMCILAHPDDETLGLGGALARYAAEGVETHLLTATRGEAGWPGKAEEFPGPQALGRLREQELRAAGEILGLKEIRFLGYQDGLLDQARSDKVTGKIAANLREIRPQVVITFDPTGAYGHPDHIAICQFTIAAVMLAASASYRDPAGRSPHQVSKLYYYVEPNRNLAIYQEAFGELVMRIDGQERRPRGWEEWAITTVIDTRAYQQIVWRAVDQHRSQIQNYQALQKLPKTKLDRFWDAQYFYRAYSPINNGRAVEDDLFAGLRGSSASPKLPLKNLPPPVAG